eukprot:scaffold118029_cov21-Phaeocystis_antarctica.AAC.1
MAGEWLHALRPTSFAIAGGQQGQQGQQATGQPASADASRLGSDPRPRPVPLPAAAAGLSAARP